MEIGDGARRIGLEADDQRSGPVEQQQAERAANEPVHKIADRQPLRGGIAAPRALQERDQRGPRLAPSTSAKAACGGTTPFAAKAAVNNIVATLECAAQVKAAARMMSIIGCIAIAPIRSRRLGTSS